jgi:hypothetical protein
MWLLQNAWLLETKLQLQALPHCPIEVNFIENTGAHVYSCFKPLSLSTIIMLVGMEETCS